MEYVLNWFFKTVPEPSEEKTPQPSRYVEYVPREIKKIHRRHKKQPKTNHDGETD
jgi:hypothetical protein